VKLSDLDPTLGMTLALAGTFSACAWVVLATYWKMPVSTSHSIVGAILGVGLVRGVRVLNVRILREIVACWVATPLVSGLISYLVLLAITAWRTR
jgi:PiT family inorganic phosphate transporter